MAVRVRFAPSPTGILHLGGARTALLNYLFARANGGRYVLRVEDTDKARFVAGSIQRLEASLRWLGVRFDEGPSIGGSHGPYEQSERLQLYRQVAKDLLKKGAVYPCFCSRKRLQSLRGGTGYDGHCRWLRRAQVEEKLQMGAPHTLRLKVPEDGSTVIQDRVYGNVTVTNEAVDDQVLLKADGYPTYHLASVVDDHHMEISHVLRGQEWLMSTAKHLLIYQSLGWKPPCFAHLPLLLSRSGGKLSKRKQDVFVESYQEKGYLPEAMVNFLALLGWSPVARTSTELFTIEELIGALSLEGISKNPVTVDEEKLLWMNKQHWKARLQQPAKLRQLAKELQVLLTTQPLSLKPDDPRLNIEHLEDILKLLEDRFSLLPEVPEAAGYFWIHPIFTQESLNSIQEGTTHILEAVTGALAQCHDFTAPTIIASLKDLSRSQGLDYRQVMLQCRIALTGTKASPALGSIMELLGKQTVLDRLEGARHAVRNHTVQLA